MGRLMVGPDRWSKHNWEDGAAALEALTHRPQPRARANGSALTNRDLSDENCLR